MRKLVTTILLILALAFVGAGIPLYMDSIDLDLDFTTEEPIEFTEETPVYSLEHQEVSATNHRLDYEIDLTYVAENSRPASSDFLEVELLYGERTLKQFTDEELTISANFEDTEEASYVHGTIEVLLDTLQVPDGEYTLQVHFLAANGDALIPAQEILLAFSSITTYEAARWEANPQTTPLQLHFPEESYEQLIPITRFVPQTNTTLRGTVTQLEQGPAEDLGLVPGSPIPPVPRIQLSGGVTSLYLSSQLGEYNENEAVAKTAAYSLVESLGFIPEVREVQFYFDNQVLAEGFLGLDTSQRFYPSEGPAYYSSFVNGAGRAFLYPVYSDTTDISNLLEKLRFEGQTDEYNHRFQPTLPEDVLLLEHEMLENRMVLNFNSAFMEFIEEAPVRGRIMLDSILLTAGSLPEVDLIQFLVDGNQVELFEGLDTINPVPAPAYVNPEN